MKARRRLRKPVVLVIIIIIASLCLPVFLKKTDKVKKINISSISKAIEKERKRQNAIKECLANNEVSEEIKATLSELENDLNNYLAKYDIGFKYQEKTLNYELSHQADKVFYGASLIKLVDANYLLDNDVDLSITKKYENKYKMAYSSKTAKHAIGDNISLGDLLNYAISVSDNSAHLMLIDYIGFNTLQEYGKSLGGKVILQGGDLFGNQTAADMIIYLNKSYELINTKENGNLLKEAMINSEVNYLNFDDVIYGHKYGSYSTYYHDVGIYFSDNSYLIAVLTNSDSNKSVVTEISKKVYNIHQKLLKEKNNYCQNIEG